MTLQTKTVVAETFVHLRQCLAEIEIEINARALRLSSLPPPQPGKMTPLHSDHFFKSSLKNPATFAKMGQPPTP